MESTPLATSSSRFKIIVSIILVLIAANLAIINYTLFNNSSRTEPDPTSAPTPTETTQTINSQTTQCDENCVKNIVKEATASITVPTTKPITQQVIAKQTTTPAPVQTKEFFFAMGNGQSAAFDWTDLPNTEKTFNPNQFGSVKSIYFEATISVPSSEGIGYVRLFNITENKPVTGSDISTTNASPTLLTSQTITLEGTKQYKIQTKQSERKDVVITKSRIKIVVN